MLWSSMARTNCRTGPRSILALRPAQIARVSALRLRLPPKVLHKPGAPRKGRPEDLGDEPVAAVHFAASRHHSPDGRRPPGGLGCLPPIAHLRVASGRLPYDSGANVLSRRQSGRHGLLGYGAPRAPVRPDPWPEPDDFHEFLRQLHHHAAIRS